MRKRALRIHSPLSAHAKTLFFNDFQQQKNRPWQLTAALC
jgi:hypothetical protein